MDKSSTEYRYMLKVIIEKSNTLTAAQNIEQTGCTKYWSKILEMWNIGIVVLS